MSAASPAFHVEAFHLAFLRLLETKLSRSRYAVKGGVNLRAWFGSERWSEDMDLDAVDLEPHALRSVVDRLLASPAFAALLGVQELALERFTAPKQTETTQRWKVQIAAPGATLPLHTKVEFSHRGTDGARVLEPVLERVVRPHGMQAPTAQHYTAQTAIHQKIRALADRRVAQARDIWDLEHLLRTTGADPRPVPPAVRDAVPRATERALDMPFEVFRAQVAPFLSPEAQELHATPGAWDRLRELVLDRLVELQQ